MGSRQKNEDVIENKTKKKKKGKAGKVFLRILLIFLVIIVIAGGVFAYKVHQNGGGLGGVASTLLGTNDEKIQNLPPVYCVLLGQSQNLTDTIMLVSYDPKTQEASLLTIPRDTFIGTNKKKASPRDKINALCQYTHPEKTVAAVAELTGIDVKNYILVDTKSLVKLVDLLGGVWFDVPIDMNYTDRTQDLFINLKAGYQLLNGDKAEQVVRFRHNQDGTTYPEEYGTEDLGRTRTQREFLMAVAKQTLQPQNILKVGDLINLGYENVKTNMTISEFKDYIPAVVKFDTAKLKTGIVPGESELANGYWIYSHDEEKTEKLVKQLFFGEEPTPETDTTGNNTVGNTAKVSNNTNSNTTNKNALK